MDFAFDAQNEVRRHQQVEAEHAAGWNRPPGRVRPPTATLGGASFSASADSGFDSGPSSSSGSGSSSSSSFGGGSGAKVPIVPASIIRSDGGMQPHQQSWQQREPGVLGGGRDAVRGPTEEWLARPKKHLAERVGGRRRKAGSDDATDAVAARDVESFGRYAGSGAPRGGLHPSAARIMRAERAFREFDTDEVPNSSISIFQRLAVDSG
jgi:hypothetical protein